MKHLSLTNRCMIEQYIAYDYSFREIAGKLGYQPSTISREVKNHLTLICRERSAAKKAEEKGNRDMFVQVSRRAYLLGFQGVC